MDHRRSIGWFLLFVVLCRCTFREHTSDYLDKVRLAQVVSVALLLGLLWWNSQTGTEAQLQDQVGLIFYICIFWTSDGRIRASWDQICHPGLPCASSVAADGVGR
jgi:hypothetical protein